MMPLFVDTGAWIGLAVRRDSLHKAASDYARNLAARHVPLLTTNYVLAETYTRIRYDDGHAAVAAFHRNFDELVGRKRVEIAWISGQVHALAVEIMLKYADQEFSLVDCTSFVVARERRIRDVFGFDSGFLVMGLSLKPGL